MTVQKGFFITLTIGAAALVLSIAALTHSLISAGKSDATFSTTAEELGAVSAEVESLKGDFEKLRIETTVSPEPTVFIVEPISAFDGYTVEDTEQYGAPDATRAPDASLPAGTNMIISGVCGDFYYATLPDGTACYVPSSAIAQVPEPTPEPTPVPTPEPTAPPAQEPAATESTPEQEPAADTPDESAPAA